MRVLLCGGGTAGHVMPAIAIAEIIEKNFKNSIIAFAGRENGDENKAYKETGYKLYTLKISGLSRSLSVKSIKSVFRLIISGRNAKRIIKDFHPDVIIGTGGYVCYPFIRQGQHMNIKTIIHESNVYPGLVTKLLGKRCDMLLLNLEGTKKYLRGAKNASVVGNPIRSGFSSINRSQARKHLGIGENETLIISFGGSLGASKLNEAVMEMINKYTFGNVKVRHIHSTGKKHFETAKKAFPNLYSTDSRVKIVPYIENMPLLLTAADLAITRSGAMTIAELCRSGTPSILIPSPNVTANHQYVNARYLKDIGAAELIEEKDLTADTLFRSLNALLDDKNLRLRMAKRAREAYPENTSRIITNLLKKLTNE